MKYFKNINTVEEAKKEYKKLAMQNHPDKGGNEEVMKEINNEYELIINILSSGKQETKTAIAYKDVIDKIINLDITIEVVGAWVWVSGNTYAVKAQLKEAGFMWASKKKKWYYRPEEAKCTSRGKKSYEEIKAKYGATTVKATSNKKYSLGA